MSLKVLMIGPGKGSVGGISTLVETIVPPLSREVDLLYFPTVQWRPPSLSGTLSFANIKLALAQYARFLPALRHFQPDIVHLHTSPALAWIKDGFYVLVARMQGYRVVVHPHAEFDVFYSQRSRLIRWYTRRLFALTAAIIALSADWGQRVPAIAPGKRVLVLKNCVDLTALAATPEQCPRDPQQILFVGAVGQHKGTFDLVEAMGLLKARGCPAKVWIAGPEERPGDAGRVQARIDELGLGDRCEMLGMVRGRQKADLFSKASILVLPSYREGLPMAVLEAMAAGLAVVATPVGGTPEIIRDGYNGLLSTPGDVAGLAANLAQVAGDPERCLLMGRRSREIAEQEFGVKAYLDQLVALYQSLVG